MHEHDEMNLATEVAENVDAVATEPTTEEGVQSTESLPEKVYTEDEFNQRVNEAVGKRMSRLEAKMRREYESKYGELETVLRAGTGLDEVADMTSTFRKAYEEKGVQIPQKSLYSAKDVAILANAEADEIISSGVEEVEEELDRLSKIGVGNMTERDKAVFQKLATHKKTTEQISELAKIGVTEDVYNSQEFREFAKDFDPRTPIKKVYEYYNKMRPHKEVQTMGSMKTSPAGETGIKDYYTYEESLKFTKEDFDKNPELFAAVQRSMLKWGKK